MVGSHEIVNQIILFIISFDDNVFFPIGVIPSLYHPIGVETLLKMMVSLHYLMLHLYLSLLFFNEGSCTVCWLIIVMVNRLKFFFKKTYEI